ncbi:MAG: zf-TFIIB domain-containing protein [Acidimicrobiia bacterium]|nr:zf-TFIIB domain-containing protein [Acidimicrobiia bacterium]
MTRCPRCDTILVPMHATGNRFECPRGDGVASNRADVGLLVGFQGRRAIVRAARDVGQPIGPQCPFCAGRMSTTGLSHPLGTVTIDVCTICEGIWSDAGELTKLRHLEVPGGEDRQSLPMMDATTFERIRQPPWKAAVDGAIKVVAKVWRLTR